MKRAFALSAFFSAMIIAVSCSNRGAGAVFNGR